MGIMKSVLAYDCQPPIRHVRVQTSVRSGAQQHRVRM